MTKPNSNFTVKQIKQYIRDNKLNHPDVKLGMRRAELVAGLKKIGHWQETKKSPPKKEAPKKVAPKKVAPKKEAPKKSPPKKEAPKKEGNWKDWIGLFKWGEGEINMPIVYQLNEDNNMFEPFFYWKDGNEDAYWTAPFGRMKKKIL